MEHDHRVVERVAQDGEQGGDGVRGDLATDEHVDTHDDDKVMQQRHDRCHAHLRIAEANRDVGDDQQQRDEERNRRRLDDACAPVRAYRGDLEAVGGPAEGVRHLVRRRRRIFSGSRGGANKEARLAVSRRGLDDRVGLARIAERVANLLSRHVARAVEGHRRAADELDAEVHAAHSDDDGDKHHRAAGRGEEDLLKPQKVDVELDEAAAHVLAGRGLLHALEVRHSLDAVLHAPELGVLRNELRGEKTNERRLEQKHHDDVAHNAQSKRHAEALDRGARQEEQRERGDERHKVGVDRGQDAVADTRDGRGAHASAHANFLAEALERQDGGVGRHADGQNDAGDARHRKAEQAECGKQREDAQIDRREHGHCRRSDDAEPFVEHEQVNHDNHKADERYEHAGLQRILAERRADDLALRVLEAHRQRAGLEHGLHLLGRVERIATGDGNVAVGDDGLHGRSRLHFAVEDDDNLTLGGSEVFGRLGEGLRALGVETQVDRIVGRSLGSLAHVDLLEVRASDDRRVRALFDLEVLHLFAREGIAERVGHRALRAVLTVLNLRLHIGISEGVQTGELELARFADGVERFLSVG